MYKFLEHYTIVGDTHQRSTTLSLAHFTEKKNTTLHRGVSCQNNHPKFDKV